MTERYFITRVSPDPINPATSLARIVFRREQGVIIQREIAEGEQPHPVLTLTADQSNGYDIQNRWDRITDTQEFKYMIRAYEGNTEFFRENYISSHELIFPANAKRFFGFYNFLRAFAYTRAIRLAELEENYPRVRELKLESRTNWTPRLNPLQRHVAPAYITSVLTRVYNLVSTGEEQPTMQDRVLDFIMG